MKIQYYQLLHLLLLITPKLVHQAHQENHQAHQENLNPVLDPLPLLGVHLVPHRQVAPLLAEQLVVPLVELLVEVQEVAQVSTKSPRRK